MKLTKLASLVLIGLSLGACSQKSGAPLAAQGQQGIIGGTVVEAGDETNVRTAALYDSINQGICTVSILNSEWILTAAHCVENTVPEALLVIFERDLVNSSPGQNEPVYRRVTHFAVHPQYAITNQKFEDILKKAEAEGREPSMAEIDALTDWGDVALIHLESAIPSTHQAVEVLPSTITLAKDQPIVLAGYGVSDGAADTGSGIFRKVETKIADPARGTMEILVDQREGKGACRGDSGGPAYVKVNGKLYLVGVTSHGVADEKNDCSQFASYSFVPAFSTWIADTMAKPAPVVAPVASNEAAVAAQ